MTSFEAFDLPEHIIRELADLEPSQWFKDAIGSAMALEATPSDIAREAALLFNVLIAYAAQKEEHSSLPQNSIN